MAEIVSVAASEPDHMAKILALMANINLDRQSLWRKLFLHDGR